MIDIWDFDVIAFDVLFVQGICGKWMETCKLKIIKERRA